MEGSALCSYNFNFQIQISPIIQNWVTPPIEIPQECFLKSLVTILYQFLSTVN